jgi:hypothetical protein
MSGGDIQAVFFNKSLYHWESPGLTLLSPLPSDMYTHLDTKLKNAAGSYVLFQGSPSFLFQFLFLGCRLLIQILHW